MFLPLINQSPVDVGNDTFSVRLNVLNNTGNVRLTVVYVDGRQQLVHFFVTPPAAAHIAAHAHWVSTAQFFNDTTDAFHRAPSFLNYDRRTSSVILQAALAWIAGLSDECGAGK